MELTLSFSFKDASVIIKGIQPFINQLSTINLLAPYNSNTNNSSLLNDVVVQSNSLSTVTNQNDCISSIDNTCSIASISATEQYDEYNISSQPNIFIGNMPKETVKPVNVSNNPNTKYIGFGIKGADIDIASMSEWERVFGFSRGTISHRIEYALSKGDTIDPKEIFCGSSKRGIRGIYFVDKQTGEMISQDIVK